MINLFKEALVFYRRHFQVIFYLLALPIVLRVVLEILRFEGFHVSTFIVAIVTIFVNVLAQAALIYLVIDGAKSSAQIYLVKAWSIFWSFLWVVILTGVASLGAALLLVVPGIIVAVFLVFSSFAVIIEEKRGVEALRTSWRLVKGRWWNVFGSFIFLVFVFIVALIIISIISSLLSFGDSAIARNIISAVISGLILSPVGAVYLFLLYQQLKKKNEL